MFSDLPIFMFFDSFFCFFYILFYFAIVDLVERINKRRQVKNKKTISITSIKIFLSLLFVILLFLIVLFEFTVDSNIDEFLVVLPCIIVIIFLCFIFKGLHQENKDNNLKNTKLVRKLFLIGVLVSILLALILYFIARFNIF